MVYGGSHRGGYCQAGARSAAETQAGFSEEASCIEKGFEEKGRRKNDLARSTEEEARVQTR
jgi:hypothetical protein